MDPSASVCTTHPTLMACAPGAIAAAAVATEGEPPWRGEYCSLLFDFGIMYCVGIKD